MVGWKIGFSLMNAQKSRPLLSGAALSSAEGFAVGFAVVGMLTRVLTLNVSEFNAGLALETLMFAGAGALGAWYLAAESRWRSQAVLFALAGLVGCGAGYLLTTYFISPRFQTPDANATILTAGAMVQFALLGGLTGLILGIAARDWRKTLFLVVAGALGFAIGFLVQSSLTDLLAEPLSDFVGRFSDADSVHLIAASLLWGLASGVCGFLGGLALGWGLER